jgi:hypothetical protein
MRPLAAQQAEPAGAVANANNATAGTLVSSGTTIFSGDLLKTGDAGRLQVQSGTMQFVFDANSAARIFRSGNRVVVELERGLVSYSAKGVSGNLTLFAQDIKGQAVALCRLSIGAIFIPSFYLRLKQFLLIFASGFPKIPKL